MEHLTNKQIETITRTVAYRIDRANREKAKQHKDYRLRNTELLLKNYRMLRVHCNGIVEDLEVYEDAVYDPSDLDLNSLMKYKAKTAKMLDYFDSIFRAYGELSKYRDGMHRRYQIVARMYVRNDCKQSANELASYFNIDRSTVTRDTKKAIDELSIMLFGIDSFDDLDKLSGE